jgi:hypothetical protein
MSGEKKEKKRDDLRDKHIRRSVDHQINEQAKAHGQDMRTARHGRSIGGYRQIEGRGFKKR